MTINDVVTIWVTKRGSFDLSCDGFTSNAVQIWLQEPVKTRNEANLRYGYAWECPHCKFIPADFFGTKLEFPFVKAVWQKICDSEVGDNRDKWGMDDLHQHPATSPNHFSNWIAELKVRLAIVSTPSSFTIPIWFTKGSDRKSARKVNTVEKSTIWFRKSPLVSLVILENDPPGFGNRRNASSLEEVQGFPKEMNGSEWNQVGETYRLKVDDFFKNLPNSYQTLKELTEGDFSIKNPSCDWMTWCKKYYLHVEVAES